MAALLTALAVAGCSNAPPPPLVSSPVARTTPTKASELNQIVVGMDSVVGGYNPHTLADQSTVTTALSSLLLPSVFRIAPDGNPQLDTTLMLSAQVTKTEPYTVSYTLRREAAWSDSAPIAAEDFVYLWQHMRSEPGVVDPAGYRLISNIASRDSGKTVEVSFAKPYPGWRSLFGGLMPAHLLKDAPGGWPAVLADSFPATGGPFAVRTLDRDRGEIQLERNDRYWDKPVPLDRVVLRKADPRQTADALGNGDNQAAVVWADAIAVNLINSAKAPLTVKPVPRPEVARLVLRPVSPRLTDLRVRSAIVAALDRNSLIAVGTGNGPSAQLRADAQVAFPSRSGYAATIPQGAPPAAQDLAAVDRLMTEAGYARLDGLWAKDGKVLTLNLAVQSDRVPYASLAAQVQHQLAAVGIQAKLNAVSGDQLYGQQLARTQADNGVDGDGSVDLAVVPSVDAGDPAALLATEFGCRAALPDASTQVPGNLSGSCDQALQPTIDAALTGEMLLSDALAKVEPVLWQQAVSVPLFQIADLLAVRQDVSGVDTGAPLAGVFSGAPNWRRANR
ncbi:ABC transporter family substrate-binding protein [Solihabitans fulvus]|uniref:ABC transporter family substrate-binding protein n=1 Tax=Solihabitans fulvus TaxID=1892852 RepID=A0A5B2XMS8_9PSEU|nr:ABC transporter family substrate-binding protein [Solihabitans fulvus]